MARTMLIESKLPKRIWAEAVNTSCYIINRAMQPFSRKTPYELFKGKSPSIAHFKVFGTKYFVHINDKRDIDKFEAKSERGIFLGYSETSRAYRIYNLKTECVEESPHVVFDESTDGLLSCRNKEDEDFIENEANQKDSEEESNQISKSKSQGEVTTAEGNSSIINVRELRDHPLDKIIGSLHEPPKTKSHFRIIEEMDSLALVSLIEPKNIESALSDEFWVNAMHDELN